MSILITNGTVVTDRDTFRADIGIVGEKIAEIGADLDKGSYDEIIDVTGKYIMPGFIDPHVHLKLPMRGTFSDDDFVTGTRAAAAGGITTIIDFATQMGDQSLIEAIIDRRMEADSDVYVDYGLHGGITNWVLVKDEMKEIIESGISSFKMFMAYKERGLYSTNEDIQAAMDFIKQYGGMILVHAESEELLESLMAKYDTPEKKAELGIMAHVLSRPPKTEFLAIEEAIQLAAKSGGHLYVVHMSTGKGADYVQEGRKKGINVIGETCPQYLLFNDDIFKQEDGYFYATAPQIKSEDDRLRLWDALSDGSIAVIGTDSCTFSSEQKNSWDGDFTKIPLGLPGSELMAPLLFSEGVHKNKISLNRFIQLVSTNAAKVFGLYPQKGTVEVGTDADITIFDPDHKRIVDYKEMETNADWNPYQGWEIRGNPIMTFLRGTLIAKDGKCIGKQGFGNYIKRGASGNYL